MYDIKRHMFLNNLNKIYESFVFFKHSSGFLVFFVNFSMAFIFGVLFCSIINILFFDLYYLIDYINPFLDSFYFSSSYLLFFLFSIALLLVFLVFFLFYFLSSCSLINLLLNKINPLKLNEYKKELKEIEDNLTLQKYNKIASSSTVTSKELFFIKSKIADLNIDFSFINSFKQKINSIKKYHPELFETRYDYDINKHKDLCDKKRDLFNYFEFFFGLFLFNNLIVLSVFINNYFENSSNFDLLFFSSLIVLALFFFVSSCFLVFSNLKRFFSKSKIEKEMIKKELNNINKNITISNIEDVIYGNDIKDIYFIEPFFKHYEYNLNNEQEILKLKSSIKEDIDKLNCYEQNKKQEIKDQKIKNKKEINII